MPTLQTRCSVQTKDRFRGLASSEGLTSSMLLRRMVAAVLMRRSANAGALPIGETRGGQGGKGDRVWLRLRPGEIEAIRALAEPEGYSAQAWIVRQLRHRLVGAVPFAREELNELRDAIRELGAVGRNLNTLLHVLHRSDRVLDDMLDLRALSERVEKLHKEVVATVARATHRGARGEG